MWFWSVSWSTIVPSMWFWSVSWSTNCPVFFSFFFGRPKKNCPVSGNFWSVSGNFWSTKFLFGVPKFFLVEQISFLCTKNSQRLTKNSLRLDNFCFGRPRKMRKRPDNWFTKRLTKTTWTGLECKTIKES